MKYEMGSDLLKTWTNNIRTSTDLQKKITDIKGQISKDEKEAQRQQENTINDQKDEKKDKEEIEPSAKKDPRKGFMKLLKEGSVSLVMGSIRSSNRYCVWQRGHNKAENMEFYEPQNDGKRDGQVKRNIVSRFICKRITGHILCTKIFSLSNRYIKKRRDKI